MSTKLKSSTARRSSSKEDAVMVSIKEKLKKIADFNTAYSDKSWTHPNEGFARKRFGGHSESFELQREVSATAEVLRSLLGEIQYKIVRHFMEVDNSSIKPGLYDAGTLIKNRSSAIDGTYGNAAATVGDFSCYTTTHANNNIKSLKVIKTSKSKDVDFIEDIKKVYNSVDTYAYSKNVKRGSISYVPASYINIGSVYSSYMNSIIGKDAYKVINTFLFLKSLVYETKDVLRILLDTSSFSNDSFFSSHFSPGAGGNCGAVLLSSLSVGYIFDKLKESEKSDVIACALAGAMNINTTALAIMTGEESGYMEKVFYKAKNDKAFPSKLTDAISFELDNDDEVFFDQTTRVTNINSGNEISVMTIAVNGCRDDEYYDDEPYDDDDY